MIYPFTYRFLSEHELLDRIKAGDSRVENFVCEKFYPAVKRQVKKLFGDNQFKGKELSDLCQDVMCLFLNRARLRGAQLLKEDGTIGRWLNATIKNTMRDMWNNQERAEEILSDLTSEPFANKPEEDADRKNELTMTIERAIAQLDKEETKKFGKGFVRQLYTYRFVHLMSWEEVTELLSEDFPNYETFPMKKPLTWEYVSRSLWNGNYDRRLAVLLKSTLD